jgi:hypothetical protein
LSLGELFDVTSGGTYSFNTGFSGSNLEFRAGFFVSGLIATPISSGRKLLLENIYGFVTTGRAGRGGATFDWGTFVATPSVVAPGA